MEGPDGRIAYHPAVVLTAASSHVARQLRTLRFGALVVVGALVAHDAIFAAQYGLGEQREAALAATAHGYWPAFAALALLVGGLGLAAAASVLLRLHRALRRLPAMPTTGRDAGLRRGAAAPLAAALPGRRARVHAAGERRAPGGRAGPARPMGPLVAGVPARPAGHRRRLRAARRGGGLAALADRGPRRPARRRPGRDPAHHERSRLLRRAAGASSPRSSPTPESWPARMPGEPRRPSPAPDIPAAALLGRLPVRPPATAPPIARTAAMSPSCPCIILRSA